jgi:diguanylate cyclase (GGDEF)-like protein
LSEVLSNKKGIGIALRWAGITIGGAICALVLATRGLELPLWDVLVLGGLASLCRRQEIVSRRASDGTPIMSFHPGDSFFIIAMLRGGPDSALATALLTIFLSSLLSWSAWYSKSPLRTLNNLFYFPALAWFGGHVYHWLGGQPILTIADSGRFFQDPRTVILPLLGMLVVCTEVINRCYQAVIIRCFSNVPVIKTLTDPLFSFFDYVENLGSLLALVLWTAWGWATIPFTFINAVALLMSAKSYFERLDARRAVEMDPLTGLASSRGLDNYLKRRVSRKDKRAAFALLYIDVDDLKGVNDRFGHAAGDEMLRLVGDTCRQQARDHDIVGRRGGDEFLVILDNLDRTAAERVVSRLQRAIQERINEHPQFSQANGGASIGLAVYPNDALDAQALIEMADRQMYANKRDRKAVVSEGMSVLTA